MALIVLSPFYTLYFKVLFDGLLIYRSSNGKLVSDALGVYVAQNITIKILDVMTGYLNTTLSVEDIWCSGMLSTSICSAFCIL